jgi:prephenate dehydrogenase
MTVGIIGLGRFGTLAAKIMSRHFNVIAYDVSSTKVPKRIKMVELKVAAAQEVVILAVPIREMKDVLKKISSYVKKGALICDVCSVKEKPVEWMKKYLPDYVSILGTHPLFGPDSVSKNFMGNDIVLCPVRIHNKFYKRIKRELENAGLNVFELTLTEHDKIMAYTQALAHAIARGIYKLPKFEKSPVTKNYQMLMEIVNSLNKDSQEMFEDITRYNRFTRGACQGFLKSFHNL